MRQKINSLIVTVAGIALAIYLAGCSGLAPGYRALVVIKDAGDQTGKTLAAVCKVKRIKCYDAHKESPPDLRACLKPCTEALRQWVKHVKPAINTANAAAFAALEIAYKAKKHEADWLSILRTSACGLFRALKQWAHLAPKQFEQLWQMSASVEGLVCK